MSQAVSHVSLIGCQLGRYRILEKIGEGGMGEVFLAHDEHLKHDVALKVLPPETDERHRRLFRKEAHALSKLNHPNIVTVLDFDTQGDLDFLVMEFVSGQPLDQLARQQKLTERDIIHIGMQLAEGLAAAHERGIIHRDLKPGNLRLTEDGRLKILDFGLARSTASLSQLASTVSFSGPPDCSGTLPYMACEQLLGQEADSRTDIYSAGAVLYELCAGHAPFEQTLLPQLIEDILHKSPKPLNGAHSGISSELETIIFTCLDKDPEERYQSAKELARELRKVENHGVPDPIRTRIARSVGLVSATSLLATLLFFLGIYYWRAANSHGTPRIESLAVLPFANLSGDSQQEYLADGITDFLITDLGQMSGVQRVISRTSVMRYKTERVPLSELSRQLKVGVVVEGSVMRSANTLRVTARLVNTEDDRQLWSRTYESEFRDLLTLQHQLAFAISRAIAANVNGGGNGQLTTTRSIEPAAQEAFLKGKYLFFGNAEQREKSRQYFEQAVQIDPNYAAAYAGLADTYWNDIGLPARETMPKASEYALKAISLDEHLADAHTALATVRFYGDWDWEAAEREYQRALQLNPSNAESHRMFSVFLAAMGRPDQALGQVLAAQELDPLNANNNTTAGWDLYCARRYDKALDQCRRALELAPNNQGSHVCLAYGYMGNGQYQQAVEESGKAWMLSNKEFIWAVLLGHSYALAGEESAARTILGQLLRQSKRSYIPPYFIAVLYADLRDKEKALLWLDKAYAERDLYLTGIKVDPALDGLRADERFQELSRRMAIPP